MREMTTPDIRRGKRRKVSVESSDNHVSEGNSVNAYGVRYGTITTGNASRGRFSRSANHLASCNATSNLARRGFDLRRSSVLNRRDAYIRELLKKNWNIYRASAMYSFEFSAEKIDRYSKNLNEMICSKTNHSNEEVTYTSELNYSAGCPASFSVKIFSNTKKRTRVNNGDNNMVKKLVYEGHFLSWNDKKENENSNQEEITLFSMPLLLSISSAGVAFTKNVHHSLMKIFDIVIADVILSQEDMAWLVCLASSDPQESCEERAAEQEVNFYYDLPRTSTQKCKPHITLTCELGLVHLIWQSVHRNHGADDEVLSKEVSTFLRSFEEHSGLSYGINLCECVLLKVTMPSASFTLEGKLKISSLVIAGRILRFLADLCAVENSGTPSLGFSFKHS